MDGSSCSRGRGDLLRLEPQRDAAGSRRVSVSLVSGSLSLWSPGLRVSGLRSSMALEAWFMDSSSEDQRKPHRLVPNQPASMEELKKLGVFYWKVRLLLRGGAWGSA